MVPQLVGPKLLTALDNMMALPATSAVNMASPRMLRDIAEGGGPALDLFLARSDAPPAALNLCHSRVGTDDGGDDVDGPVLMKVIDRLLTAPPGALFPAAARTTAG